jgi:hypothetical protein
VSPEKLKDAPRSRPVRRLDEVRAAKQPVVRYDFGDGVSTTVGAQTSA